MVSNLIGSKRTARGDRTGIPENPTEARTGTRGVRTASEVATDGDADPTEPILPGLIQWLSGGVGLSSSGGPGTAITNWADQSGNAFDMTPHFAVASPLLGNFNGVACADFPTVAGDRLLAYTGSNPLPTTGAASVMAAIRPFVLSGPGFYGGTVWDNRVTNGTAMLLKGEFGTRQSMMAIDGSASIVQEPYTDYTDADTIIAWTWDAAVTANVRCWINGFELTGLDPTTYTRNAGAGTGVLLGTSPFLFNPWRGLIGEVLVYAAQLSGPQVIHNTRYLRGKFGIS